MSMDLPEGSLSAAAAVVINFAVVVWKASAASSQIKNAETRLDKLEVKVEDQGLQQSRILLDVSQRLTGIETKLGILMSDLPFRRDRT